LLRASRTLKASPDASCVWVASCIQTYLAKAPDGARLEELLGLATPPGGTPWWAASKQSRRDKLLRQVAMIMDGSTHQRAIALQAKLRHYASTEWARDCVSKQPSAANANLFRIYSLDPDPPTGIRRLTEIIGE
jgi:hypothetical protein